MEKIGGLNREKGEESVEDERERERTMEVVLMEIYHKPSMAKKKKNLYSLYDNNEKRKHCRR